MSEHVTAEELVRNVTFSLQRSSVIPMPIDPTLSNEGEAADAKATGDAIAAAVGVLKVNNKSASSNNFTLYASDINMSNAAGAKTISQAIQDAEDRDASDIIYDADESQSVAAAIDDIKDALDTGLDDTEIDEIFAEVFGGDE